MLNRAAPRSGSSPRSSLFSPSVGQFRAASRAPPEADSSHAQSSSPAQRELPQKQPLLSLNRPVVRSERSPRGSLLPCSIEQPHEAGDPPRAASSLPQSISPAQRERPQKQPPPVLNRAAPRSGSSPQSSLLPPAFYSSAQRKLTRKACFSFLSIAHQKWTQRLPAPIMHPTWYCLGTIRAVMGGLEGVLQVREGARERGRCI